MEATAVFALIHTPLRVALEVRTTQKLYTMDLLVKGTAHTRMKVIGEKTTVKTSATSLPTRFDKISEEDEDEDDLSAVFCRQVWRCILATWGVSLDRERLAMCLEGLEREC